MSEPLEQRFTLVTLGVSDVQRSRAFYEKLGWTVSAFESDAVAFFQMGGVVLGLYGHDALAEDASVAPMPAPDFRGVSIAWNARDEAGVDAALSHAVEVGARLVKPAKKAFWGGYSGYFADPDGHLWEVSYNPEWPIAVDGSVKLPS